MILSTIFLNMTDSSLKVVASVLFGFAAMKGIRSTQAGVSIRMRSRAAGSCFKVTRFGRRGTLELDEKKSGGKMRL